ncbi:DUF6543 domain-containing protein [Pseudomonas asplenii]|uniref:DUF6543 domain-containing protein n=1 Tax=Pseudomonas asplenii TaxID=53407 RepID=UPI00035DB504|nr:DUF6543 domain-containing protein [Pseudomonas fuscovaginae]
MSAVTPPALDEHSENEEVIRANAPDWLLQARTEDIGQLREYLRNSQLFKEEVLFRLKALKPVLAFCEPLLEQALLTRFGRGLDVHRMRCSLSIAGRTCQHRSSLRGRSDDVYPSQPAGGGVAELRGG